jgi:hypothetical protein
VNVFRCTQRLAKRLRVSLADDALPSAGILGDWYANVLNVERLRLVLCISEQTILPVILPIRQTEFPSRFPSYLSVILEHIEIAPDSIQHESHKAGEPVFAKTRNRSLLGTLNDFSFCASEFIRQGESILEANIRLAHMPSKAIDYNRPRDATIDLLARRTS